jgi:GNAT superfamily N-acetyltransferase
MITVRPARPDDAERIAGMARALSLADGGLPSRFSADAFARDGFGENAAFAAVVAEIAGEIAGYAIYYPGYDTDSATRGIYLADLYVEEARRRQGVGRELLAGLAAQARSEGARWMFWSVLKRNRGARRFYKKIAPELKDVIVCAAFGRRFEALADRAG